MKLASCTSPQVRGVSNTTFTLRWWWVAQKQGGPWKRLRLLLEGGAHGFGRSLLAAPNRLPPSPSGALPIDSYASNRAA